MALLLGICWLVNKEARIEKYRRHNASTVVYANIRSMMYTGYVPDKPMWVGPRGLLKNDAAVCYGTRPESLATCHYNRSTSREFCQVLQLIKTRHAIFDLVISLRPFPLVTLFHHISLPHDSKHTIRSSSFLLRQAAFMPQPAQNAPLDETIQALPIAASMNTLKSRHSTSVVEPVAVSPADLFKRSNPSAASLYASTLSPPGSRPLSPAQQASSGTALSGSVFDPAPGRELPDSILDNPGEPVHQITQSFVPHVSIYASGDTELLIKRKGLRHGLWELLRPFGERIQGKVTVRDSNGISRAFEDFAIRFTRFGDNLEHPDPSTSSLHPQRNPAMPESDQKSYEGGKSTLAAVENVVERHLAFAESTISQPNTLSIEADRQWPGRDAASPYYSLYMRRLLSGIPITPHETFAHPVACVIAISSQNETPIEELRKLYTESNEGEKRLPVWVDNDYLRYYVLVHDEESDDISRSMGLFEQMKRHLGLHCHLLRLRCSKSAETDDDSIRLPASHWMSAAEELAMIQKSEDEGDFEDPTQYIFESDEIAIRTFVRELVTQSIVPTMERHISVWNDQVASRRRGITGRFMNLSRKWAGLGGSSRSSSAGSISSKDGYDNSGYYRADAAEAIMRKLADYAFMLRDWNLAHSTYDLLRSDFNESKAWKYHAAANEMAAVSLLMAPRSLSPKARAESIDQMLEAAFYSYNTRCGAPSGVARSLLLGLELLRVRGGSNIDDASRWGLRLLESRILGRVGDALLKERICACYSSKSGIGSWGWGSRHRKAAIWSILAAEAWSRQAKYLPAQRCLSESQRIYENLLPGKSITQFLAAEEHISSLRLELCSKLGLTDEAGQETREEDTLPAMDVESEAFSTTLSKRLSTISRTGALETAPLRGETVGGYSKSSAQEPALEFE